MCYPEIKSYPFKRLYFSEIVSRIVCSFYNYSHVQSWLFGNYILIMIRGISDGKTTIFCEILQQIFMLSNSLIDKGGINSKWKDNIYRSFWLYRAELPNILCWIIKQKQSEIWSSTWGKDKWNNYSKCTCPYSMCNPP